MTEFKTKIQKIAAFSDGATGGNPAGVVIDDKLPSREEMQDIAAEIGFSETVFAAPDGADWIVRYFSPESEVPFCGHATIALGAALAMENGDGIFRLNLLLTSITVEGRAQGEHISVSLQSPPTNSAIADTELVSTALALFNLSQNELDPCIAPAIVEAGATHLLLALNTRETLANMAYDLDLGRAFMNANNLVTIILVYAETDQLFHTRNPFASGGVYEDPATGAATAALAGHLRKIDWPHAGDIDIVQGEDMGSRSILKAQFTSEQGSSIRVSGIARIMD